MIDIFSQLKYHLNNYTLYDLLILFSLYLLIKLFINIYKNFFRNRLNLTKRYGKDSWCLITGATDGIGKSFSFELAKEGFNIILVSRTLKKLIKTSEEIKQKYNYVKTHIIEYDFYKKNHFEEYKTAFSTIQQEFDISILINNVGTDHHDGFPKLSLEDISQELTLNISPQAYLTKIFWENLSNRNKTKNLNSAIINVASFVADFPFAMKSIYSATKAFDHYMSIGLENELTGEKIDFLSVKPLEVATPLTGTEPDGFFIITPEQCVNAVLNDLGYESETYSHWGHKLQAYVINIIPRFLVYWFMKRFWYIIMPNPHAKKN